VLSTSAAEAVSCESRRFPGLAFFDRFPDSHRHLRLDIPTVAETLGGPPWSAFLAVWAVLGACYASVLTPSGRLLRRSAHPEDRPAVFAAQFALSHACWLLTYPLAGWAGDALGMAAALALLGGLAALGVIAARRLWPAGLPREIVHDHPDLPADHPHLRTHGGPGRHAHAVVIDDDHPVWPSRR
jgi:hypothetical protein